MRALARRWQVFASLQRQIRGCRRSALCLCPPDVLDQISSLLACQQGRFCASCVCGKLWPSAVISNCRMARQLSSVHIPLHAFRVRPGQEPLEQSEARDRFRRSRFYGRILTDWKCPREAQPEPRFAVIGRIGHKIWTAFITYRGENVRLISVRRARESEERSYHEPE